MTKDQFLEECRFAKTVATAHGDAILVAGMVFNVTAPETDNDWNVVEALTTALRRTSNDSIGLVSGSMAASEVTTLDG